MTLNKMSTRTVEMKFNTFCLIESQGQEIHVFVNLTGLEQTAQHHVSLF